MDFELGRVRIGPVCDIDQHSHLANARRRNFKGRGGRFEDIESGTVEEIGVIAEDPIELWNQRMILR
jgi:hypothetical protein